MDKFLTPESLVYKLQKMDIPFHKVKTNKSGLEWLQQKLPERNSGHPDFELVMKSINHILETKTYTN